MLQIFNQTMYFTVLAAIANLATNRSPLKDSYFRWAEMSQSPLDSFKLPLLIAQHLKRSFFEHTAPLIKIQIYMTQNLTTYNRALNLLDGTHCDIVVKCLSLMHNFIQQNFNLGSLQVETLLVGSQRLAMMNISDIASHWK